MEQKMSNKQAELTQYNAAMIQKFKDKIYNGELKIQHSILLKSSTIKELKVANCCLKEINAIQLENLEILDASYNSALKIQDIEKYKYLKQLDISSTNLVDIYNLKLQQLCSLQLRNNKIKDIPSLSNSINLVELDLSQNADIDIDPIQQLKQLRVLKLSKCNLQSVKILELLTELTELKIYLEINIQALQYLVNLKKLNISRTNNNIDVLKSLYNLEELDISYNEIIDINVQQYLVNLTKLNLYYSCKLRYKILTYYFNSSIQRKQIYPEIQKSTFNHFKNQINFKDYSCVVINYKIIPSFQVDLIIQNIQTYLILNILIFLLYHAQQISIIQIFHNAISATFIYHWTHW
ncbi:Leucine_rich repeats-containing protein [Hexamita inflata]|uniref:Leucine_rich repeats-containing protein n=1 Tax=Hexamita inflata TaxID=28002 RepID=A0ABP1HYL3_9EUKA